jgi:uncharacterized membrane protein (UPF0182 family)
VTNDTPSGGEGRGGRTVVAEAPGRRGRTLLWTLVVLGLLALTAVLFSGFYTDLLWYRSVGGSEVFWTQLTTRLVLMAVFGLLMAFIVGFNMWLAYRLRPVFRVMSPEQASLERYRMALDPLRRVAMIGVPRLLGLLAGVSATSEWKDWMLFRNATQFGVGDPTFNIDVGFYVFTLPFLSFVLGFLFAAVVLGFIAAVVVHYLYGGIRLQPADDRFSTAAQAHLSILIGIFLLLKAAAYWLDRYAVTHSTDDKVDGITYKDVNALIPGQTILVWVSVICAVLFFLSAFRKGVTLALTGLVLFVATSLIVGTAYPSFVQSFQVLPTELVRESPYIQNNIDATRAAYDVARADVQDYDATSTPTPADVKASEGTLENIRLLDPAIVGPTFKQFEGTRTQYRFPDSLDIDRYVLNGKTRGAVIALRELTLSGLADSERNWANDHVIYTHGFGVVAAYDNTTTVDGKPQFFENGIPQQGPIPVDQPRIYVGEYSPAYSIVGAPAGSTPREIDFPTNSGQETYTYQGDGGVAIGSTFTRFMYAVKYGEPNFVLSDLVNSESRILEVRDPRDRVSKLAPWLHVDGDPYPIAVDGKVLWVVDGYTTSNEYPNAVHTSFGEATTDTTTQAAKNVLAQSREEINYIRNSVKATVDAYTGEVRLYQWDENDPIVATWMKAFPGTVLARNEMPASVLAHVRYPEDLFKVQREVFAQYHVTDPSVFYSGQDFWNVPNDPTRTAVGSAQPPYYLQVQMPGQSAPAFSLTTTFAPNKRNSLAAFMAVNSEPGPNFGRMQVLQLPSSTTIPGPAQMQPKFESDPFVSQQLTPLRLKGSEVDLGNLLSLPVANGVLYVEPVYIRGSNQDGYPLLHKVLASFGNKIAFKDNLADALAEVLGSSTSPGSNGENNGNSNNGGPGTDQTLQQQLAFDIARAQDAYTRGQKALTLGDFKAYGEAQADLKKYLDDAAVVQKKLGVVGPSPSPAPSGSSSTAPSGTVA